MGKQRWIKAGAALLGGAALILGAVTAANRLSKDKDSYRSILIYQLDGSAEIDRPGTGAIKAVENLHLESGDVLTVGEGSYTRLRLDDDKYAMVEENSVLSMEASGEKENSKTSIRLTQGTMVNEIQNPLSPGSQYQVTTPNSVMAVRGTIFRVEIYFDEKGEVYVKLSVFEGCVTSRLLYGDGSTGSEVSVEAGNQVIIHSNKEVTEYLGEAQDNEYDQLSLQTLYVLRDMMDQGKDVPGITRQELEELIRRLEQGSRSKGGAGHGAESGNDRQSERESGSLQAAEKGSEPQTAPSETHSSQKQESETTGGQTRPSREPDSRQPQSQNPPESPAPQTTAAPEETAPLETTAQTEPASSPETSRDNPQNPSRHTAPGGDSGGRDDPEDRETTAPRETESSSTAPLVYTVTFLWEGTEFGSQEVESGQRAERPKLNPAAQGDWDFDFHTPILEDTEIRWK